jgi:hypothetical protein
MRRPPISVYVPAAVESRHVADDDGVADSEAVRSQRKRLHAAGNHSTCRPGCERRLRVATADDVSGLYEAVNAEFGPEDPVVRSLALRLATVASEGHGTAAVMALRGLGELVAAQRGGP